MENLKNDNPNRAPEQLKLKRKPLDSNKMSIQPGSPNKPESVPVGIDKKRFESDKHTDKRMNKMFKETGQPTLGVWNHDKKDNPMAKPDAVKFNPDLAYKPSKEQLAGQKGTINENEKIRLMMGIPEERWNASKNDVSENEPDAFPLSVDDMPGTPVVTERLKDFIRFYLKKQGGLSPEFIDATANNIGNNQHQADWYKERLKEYVDSKSGGKR